VPQILNSGVVAPTSLFVTKEGDVYVTADELQPSNWVAVLWKNGEKQLLSDGTSDTATCNVFVSGKDVYVTGYESELGQKATTLIWINGRAISLKPYDMTDIGRSVFVVEKDT
jgi:hypothetical protein